MPVLFSVNDARRIAKTVKTVEKDFGDSPSSGRRSNPTPPIRWVIRGKLAGTLSAGLSATLNVWRWNGTSDAATGETITVWDWMLGSAQTIASGKKVVCEFDVASGRYYVTSAECG